MKASRKLSGHKIIMKNSVTSLYIINNHFGKEFILTIVALNKCLRKRLIKEVIDHHSANFKILKK